MENSLSTHKISPRKSPLLQNKFKCRWCRM